MSTLDPKDPRTPPPDHPIWKIWDHNTHANDTAWRIECAKSGCWECHRWAISSYRSRVRLAESDRARGVTRFPDEKREADLKALTEYAAYRAIAPFKRSVGGQFKNTDDIHTGCAIAGDYIKLRESGRDRDNAIWDLEEKYGVGERTISKALSLFVVKATK